MQRWTVHTKQGAFIAYAPTAAAARRKITRQGHDVTDVRPRNYRSPSKSRRMAKQIDDLCSELDKYEIPPEALTTIREHAEWLRRETPHD